MDPGTPPPAPRTSRKEDPVFALKPAEPQPETFLNWLGDQLPAWTREGLLTEDQARRIRARYDFREGERILLRVVPVDPRDIFMGEHVVLGYEVSRLDAARAALDFVPREGETFYLRLEPRGGRTPSRVARAPGGRDGRAVWLRGTCRRFSGSVLSAEYGVEKFYVAEGRGPGIENAVRHGTVEAELAVAPDGTATLAALLVNGERVE